MLFAQTSSTGTIRETFQDHLLVDKQLNLAVIIDGTGPEGAAYAAGKAEKAHGFLSSICHVTGSNDALTRLCEAFTITEDAKAVQVAGSSAAWMHRGRLTVFASGTCLAALRKSAKEQWQIIKNDTIDIEIAPEMLILLGTEGISRISDSPALLEALDTCIYGNAETLARLNDAAGAIYEGDDRSLILIETEESDKKAGEPHEIELFEHYNREFSFKLWAPLTVLATASAASILLAKRLLKLWRNFSK